METYVLLKTLHVIGATVLLGTGAGIAFFMLMAHRTRDPALIAHSASVVVLADTIFTASAVILQPLTGAGLAALAGFPLLSGWIGLSLGLYVVTGLCWLPVVWIQIQLRNMAKAAASTGTSRICGIKKQAPPSPSRPQSQCQSQRPALGLGPGKSRQFRPWCWHFPQPAS